MAPVKHFFVFLICLFPFLASVSMKIPKGITLKLIHRHSIRFSSSSSQQSNMSLDLSSQAFGGSMSHLDGTITGCGAPGLHPCPKDIQASLWPTSHTSVFFVEFYIKDTSHRVLAVMDTGSRLTWVHCIPCTRCREAGSQIFDPSTSSTYRNVSCRSSYCEEMTRHSCSELGNCEYTISYFGASSSSGSLSMESFIFKTSDDGLVTVPDVVFGCSHHSLEHPDLIMGVVGLSARMTSLATQFGGKFSYCVGNIKDHAYEYNQLSFGDAAIFEGDVTPLVVDPFSGLYYLDLEGISLGGTMVDLPTGTFKKIDSWRGGVMIDSGSEATFIPGEVYDILTKVVRKTASQLRSQFRGSSGIRRLCFEGNMSTDTEGFPILRFHFPGGAELAMEADSLFIQTETALFCMTLVTDSRRQLQHFLLGINAQQYNNIGIDPAGKKLYIQRIECELLNN